MENFEITDIEKDIIVKHMFPLNMALPKYKETVVIILVDKYCGLIDVLHNAGSVMGYVTVSMLRTIRTKWHQAFSSDEL